jgi:glycosyltransferase involved in cell wall biosynthesis
LEDADICFVAGATMVKRETIDRLQELKKKLVVRLDNVPRNSRNRNTGTSRLKEFSQRADALVWQCNWAKFYLEDFIGRKDGTIIYNGVDTDIFKPEGAKMDFGKRENVYLYSRFNRDETKNWEVAWYNYQLIQRENPEARLILVGQFSPEQVEYNFDFFRGEKVSYLGIVQDPETMANIMRSCGHLLATYFNDCYSNTYQEALACGMKLDKPNLSGGTPELIDNFELAGVRGLKLMGQDYLDLFKKLV